MQAQGSLFDPPPRPFQADPSPIRRSHAPLHRVGCCGPRPPRARNTDPRTSAAAERSLSPGRQAQQTARVIDALDALVCEGATRDELARLLAWTGDRSVLSRRITDVVQAGQAVDSGRTRPGASGRQQVVWVTVRCAEAA